MGCVAFVKKGGIEWDGGKGLHQTSVRIQFSAIMVIMMNHLNYIFQILDFIWRNFILSERKLNRIKNPKVLKRYNMQKRNKIHQKALGVSRDLLERGGTMHIQLGGCHFIFLFVVSSFWLSK